ncbi:MAG: hypothetical protein V2A77_09020, partial [Pseudomonadota bacterium]
LADLARDKGLPVDFLKALGLHDLPHGGVGVPYKDATGHVVETKRRTALRAKDGSQWVRDGKPLLPYGLDRLAKAREKGKLLLVEGESDSWTAWQHNLPCLGIPGASATGCLKAAHLEGITRLSVWQEPDGGGKAFVAGLAKRLGLLGWQGEAKVIQPPEGIKDLNDLHRRHLDSPKAFKTALKELAEAAQPLPEPQTESVAKPEAETLPVARCLAEADPESPLAAAIRTVALDPPQFESEVDAELKAIAKAHKCSAQTVRHDYGQLRKQIEKQRGGQTEPDPEDERQAARKKAGELLTCPDILSRVVEAVHALGVAGEERAIKLIYLAVTSRRLERPVSLAIKAQSSAGKSYTMHSTLKLFPETAFFALTGASEKALLYTDEPFAHRHIVLMEAEALSEGFGAMIVRSLLSEGRLVYDTVEKDAAGRLGGRRIEKEGPTGLLLTTTKAAIHAENETRLLSLSVTDDPDQTARILLRQAEEADDPGSQTGLDLVPWHALQRYLELTPCVVRVTYAPDLAKRCGVDAVRMRRDFPQVLSLISAHALLHQGTREKDEQGRIVATPADYTAVHAMVADLVAEGTGAAASPAVRAVVGVVTRLCKENEGKPVTVSEVAKATRLHKDTARARIKSAIKRGWLADQRIHKNKASELIPGESMPDGAAVLPSPYDLFSSDPSQNGSSHQARRAFPVITASSGLKTPTSSQLGLKTTQSGLKTPTSSQNGVESLNKGSWLGGLKPNPGDRPANGMVVSEEPPDSQHCADTSALAAQMEGRPEGLTDDEWVAELAYRKAEREAIQWESGCLPEQLEAEAPEQPAVPWREVA